ncbi:hypothetical protein LTR86_002767 [Recurvomyces mirabilis]|nr:hypothetical protein LTR86_002767 [Recurvomyces mirabilis]
MRNSMLPLLLFLASCCTADLGCPPPPGDLFTNKAKVDVREGPVSVEHNITTDNTIANQPLSPRWYGLTVESDFKIDELPPDWQRIRTHEPWPPLKCSGGIDNTKRWMTYCFVDDDAAEHLVQILVYAMARWRPASRYTTFNIAPETRCYDWATKSWNFRCICTPDSRYALRISDGRTIKDDALAEVGYTNAVPLQNTVAFDHNFENSLQWSDTSKLQVEINAMTHELGHVAGLLHEHQRPDAALYVEVKCRRFKGYNDAEEKAREEIREGVFEPGSTLADRMKKICTTWKAAQHYMPMLHDWVPGVPNTQFRWTSMSQSYDYGSIMGYDSLSEPNASKDSAAILRKDGVNNGIIYAGGHKDPRFAAVSVMDVMRIAQLYPGDETQRNEAAAMAEHGSWPHTVVMVDEVATTVMPVPMNTAPVSGSAGHGNIVVDEAADARGE